MLIVAERRQARPKKLDQSFAVILTEYKVNHGINRGIKVSQIQRPLSEDFHTTGDFLGSVSANPDERNHVGVDNEWKPTDAKRNYHCK